MSIQIYLPIYECPYKYFSQCIKVHTIFSGHIYLSIQKQSSIYKCPYKLKELYIFGMPIQFCTLPLYCIIIIWVMIFAEKRFKKFSKFLPKWRFTELKGCRNEVLPNWRFENIFSRLPKWRFAEMKSCRNSGTKLCPSISFLLLLECSVDC